MDDIIGRDEGPTYPQPDNQRRSDVRVFVRIEERMAIYTILHVHAAAGLDFLQSCQRAIDALESAPDDADGKRTALRLAALQALAKQFGEARQDAFLYDVFEAAGISLPALERAFLSVKLDEVSQPQARSGFFQALGGVLSKDHV